MMKKEMSILDAGIEKLKSIKSEQLIVVETSKHNYMYLENNPISNPEKDEDKFIGYLKEQNDLEIEKILCLWNNGESDLPSYNLRKKLIELSPKNKETKIVLKGIKEEFNKRLDSTMPRKKGK